ncbi:hypothetical protein ONZ45_g5216 [Pleurotus djamor]|nr:hypothetical protein ONZ45_g5216 [Pleurotus djamor]
MCFLTNAAVLSLRQTTAVCNANGSRGSCSPTDAGKCASALKAQFSRRSDGKLSFSGNYGAFTGGCRCYAQCRTGPNFPTCIVDSKRVDQHFNQIRNTCISSAAEATGYLYADNVKWEFDRK